MKIIKFNEFESTNESLREYLLSALISIATIGTVKGQARYVDRENKIEYVKTDQEKRKDRLIKQGWSLDKTEVKKIFNSVKEESPETRVVYMDYTIGDVNFSSGEWELGREVGDKIKSILEKIVDDEGVLISVFITSSTDKQQLSKRTKERLKDSGYEQNNRGLSKARNESVSKIVEGEGVNKSLINLEILSEVGDLEIDVKNRFVNIRFNYLITNDTYPEVDDVEKSTYYLSKPYDSPKTKKRKSGKSVSGVKSGFSGFINKYKGPNDSSLCPTF
jgi:hypothetical protein